jgi:hypothetical protein
MIPTTYLPVWNNKDIEGGTLTVWSSLKQGGNDDETGRKKR